MLKLYLHSYLLEVESFQRVGARKGQSDLFLFKGDIVAHKRVRKGFWQNLPEGRLRW